MNPIKLKQNIVSIYYMSGSVLRKWAHKVESDEWKAKLIIKKKKHGMMYVTHNREILLNNKVTERILLIKIFNSGSQFRKQ